MKDLLSLFKYQGRMYDLVTEPNAEGISTVMDVETEEFIKVKFKDLEDVFISSTEYSMQNKHRLLTDLCELRVKMDEAEKEKTMKEMELTKADREIHVIDLTFANIGRKLKRLFYGVSA